MAAKKKTSRGKRTAPATRKAPAREGYYAYAGLDRVLHEKARLGILTALITRAEGLLFTELRELCAMTDGNLSRHIQVLQESELIEVWKGYQGKRPQTLVRMSAAGREAFLAYVKELERVIRDARLCPGGAVRDKGEDLPPGWVLA